MLYLKRLALALVYLTITLWVLPPHQTVAVTKYDDFETEEGRPKPKVEPMDHMPKEERIDWEYNLYMMDEPDEYILMFEQTTKRYPIPIDETSQNLSVITRRQIERMNAHSVSDILKRVTGVFVNSNGGELGSFPSVSIEKSDARHVLTMIDGVPINSLSSGNAVTNDIPVGIIDRIEVLKGPASSVWGSSLGGVINIITRTGGEDLDQPASAISSTYGENSTSDSRATFTQKFKDKYGVIFHASHQHTDGIMPGRGFEKESYFLKLNSDFSKSFKADMSVLFSDFMMDEPTTNNPNWLEDSDTGMETLLGNINLEFKPSDRFTFNLSGFHYMSDFETKIYYHPTDDLLYHDIFDEASNGVSAKMHIKMWGLSTTTLGFDYTDCDLEQSDDDASWGLTETNPQYEKYAFFLNQTYDFYHFMILPGIRVDYNDISKEFISPSLGFSVNFSDDFVGRFSIARGFTAPPIAMISEGFWNTHPNPDLKREEVWSYQAGFETTELWFMAIKSNFFYHDLKDKFASEWVESVGKRRYINKGKSIRQGGELELTTKAFYKFILYGNGAYVYTKDKPQDGSPNTSTNTYTGNIGLRYNDRQTFRYELNGHFLDFDKDEDEYYTGTDIIWDFTLCKTVKYWGKYHIELIGKVHNIFDGEQFEASKSYWAEDDYKNPHRWVEAGVSLKF